MGISQYLPTVQSNFAIICANFGRQVTKTTLLCEIVFVSKVDFHRKFTNADSKSVVRGAQYQPLSIRIIDWLQSDSTNYRGEITR
jgi:hypothetical protein